MKSIPQQPVSARQATVTIACFNSEKDVIPKPWTGPMGTLFGETHQVREEKAGTYAYSAVAYRKGAARGNGGVESVTGIVLDLDHLTTVELDQVRGRLSALVHVIHSSFSDRVAHAEDRCARVFLPMARWLSPDQARRVRDNVVKVIGVLADENAVDAARIWFMPACPKDRHQDSFIIYNDGILLDPDPILALAPEEPPAGAGPAKAADVWRALAFAGAVEGDRNVSLSKLAGHYSAKASTRSSCSSSCLPGTR